MKAAKARLWVVAGLLLALLMAGCDSGGSARTPQAGGAASGTEAAPVKDLAEILASGPTFKDLKSNSVTLLIDTKIPVACAAAYGTTTAYGQLATDTDMAGGAHTNHHPVLAGLQPDTEYHLRVQGVGPDGTLYRSKDYTFRTPKGEAGQGKPQGNNLALISSGARVTGVSSNYTGGDNSSQFGANHAFDGDPSTQWSSNGDGDKAWVEIDLAKRAHVTGIGFWTRTMGSSAQILSFRVLTDDGKSYGPFKLDDASSIHYFPVNFTAQRLRFEAVDTNGGNTGAVEIQVYGDQ